MEITWLLRLSSEIRIAQSGYLIRPSGRPENLRIPQVCPVQIASLAAKLSFLNRVVNSQKSVNRKSSVAQDKIKAFSYFFQCVRYIRIAFIGFQNAAMAIAMKLSVLQRASSLYGSQVPARFGSAPSQSFTPTIKIFSEQPFVHFHGSSLTFLLIAAGKCR